MVKLYIKTIDSLKNPDAFQRQMQLMHPLRRKKVLSRKGEEQFRSLAAGIALREALLGCGIDYATCEFLQEKNGLPVIKEHLLHFNLSHSGELAICGISDKPLGVDTESLLRTKEMDWKRLQRIAKRSFSEEEQRQMEESRDAFLFTRIWTRKESYAKALGAGLSMDFKTIDTTGNDFYTNIFYENYVCSLYQNGLNLGDVEVCMMN